MTKPEEYTRVTNDDELNKMRTAGRLAASVLEMIEEYVNPGINTGVLDMLCHSMIVDDLDAVPAALNYTPGYGTPPFPKSVCISVNHVVCHGIPNSKKVLKSGDIVNIDVALVKDGFYGDTSKTFLVGKPTIMGERLTRITQECLYKGIEAVRPGASTGDIGFVIQRHAEKHNYSVVRELCGHGVGNVFHGKPQILHFGKPGTGTILEEGMTFTIEPMINAGARFIKMLPDLWTIVTKDHKLSAQWEHTILVTAMGSEILTKRSEE